MCYEGHMGQSRYVCLEGCTVKRMTDKAALLEYNDEEIWIPFSQIAEEDFAGLEEGQEDVNVSVTEWIADQKGISR